MIRNLLCFFLLLCLGSSVKTQITNYSFSANTGAAAAFVPVTGVTASLTPNCGYFPTVQTDEGYAALPIGFTFTYLGINYTTLNVSTDGFATLGTSGFTTAGCGYDNTNGLSTTPIAANRPVLAPLWDDLDVTGGIQYTITGTAPLRVFTAQWTNALWDYGGASPAMSFQLKLYETSNIIEYVYRQESGTIVNGSGGASIGITAGATGAGNFLSLSSSTNSATVSSTVETQNIATKPATGQIFRFDPRYCAARGLFLTGGEKISRVVFSTLDNSSTSDAEFENFTTLSTTVQPSSTYNLSVYLFNSYSGDHVVVYIDYNNNGVFTDAGETVYSSINAAGPFLNVPITIPAGATLGYTRMRVRLDDAGSPGSNPSSCGDAAWGQVEDYSINISTCTAASITTQPANTFICNGSNGSISVGAAGTGLNYQWQLSTNGGSAWGNVPAAAPYSGTTSSTLTITGAIAGMTGYMYRVLITGTCSPLVTSSAATLTVTTAAAFTLNPINASGCVGTTASFSVLASGTSPTFQWQVSTDNGVTYNNISGATSATLSLTGLTSAQNATRYRAVATVAGCGSVTSSAAILTVNALPTVTIAAAPVTAVKPGVSTTLTVTSNPAAATGGFAWTLNGTPVAGATANTLQVDVSGIGTYTATVTDVNGCKNTTSALTITADASDKFFIYPNPSTGVFQLRLYAPNLFDVRSVTIYNSIGVKVAEKDFNVNARYDKMEFDLRHVPPGVYSIHLEQRYVKRTVVGQVVIIR
jgi:hypothetical protein